LKVSGMRAVGMVLLAAVTAVCFMTSQVGLTSAQVVQGSPAWKTGYWFIYSGGMNRIYFGMINMGTKPVTVCYNVIYGGNSSVVNHGCSTPPISPGQSAGFYVSQGVAGSYGTVIVYSQDSSTPLAPAFGYMTIDQQGNNVINAVSQLDWSTTSPPSS